MAAAGSEEPTSDDGDAVPAGSHASGHSTVLRRIGTGLIAVATLLVGTQLWWARDRALDDARRSTGQAARLLTEHAERAIQGAERLLHGVTTDLPLPAGDSASQALLDLRALESPQVELIALLDADGAMLARSGGPVPPGLNLADREYFRIHRDRADAELHISAPIAGAISGRGFVIVSRRLSGPSGEFAGVAYVGLDPEYFRALYRDVMSSPMDMIELRRADGVVLVHAGTRDPPAGDALIGEGAGRRYPVVVRATMSQATALAGWTSGAVVLGLGWVALAALTAAALWLLGRQVHAIAETRQAATAAAAMLRTMLDRMPEGVSMHDRAMRIRLWNDRLIEMLGLPRALMRPGVTHMDVVRWQASQGEFGPGDIEEIVRSRAPMWIDRPVQYQRQRRDGRWVEIRRNPLPNGGQVTLYIDIDQQKRHEVELAATTMLLRTTLESMADGVMAFDALGRLRTWNRQAGLLLDLPEGALAAGVPWSEIATGPGRAAPAGNEGAWVWSLAGPRFVRCHRTAMPDGGNVVLLADVTDELRVEQRLRAARDEAEAASRTKSLFLATMSHELRTPLNAIIGFSDIIHRRRLGPAALERYAEYAGDVHAAGVQLLALVNDVLDMSRIESGRYELSEEWVELTQLLQSSIGMTRERARLGGLALTIAPAPGPYVLRVDRRAIKQIVLNLLSNAIKFTPAGGSITMTARAGADGGLGIEVRDTGIGIARDKLDQVFEPFHQADPNHDRQFEGAGLGLSISRSLAELHGGRIAVESALGTGTAVTFWVPPIRVARAEGWSEAAS